MTCGEAGWVTGMAVIGSLAVGHMLVYAYVLLCTHVSASTRVTYVHAHPKSEPEAACLT